MTYASLRLITALLPHLTTEEIRQPQLELQNEEYEGATFKLATLTYRSRLAKKTPNKKGYFVVFWEKENQNKNQAYSLKDSADKLIVTILDDQDKGQFIFPKQLLFDKGILKSEQTQGKMGIRVYPNWVVDLNKTAERTQQWQTDYFIDLSSDIDVSRLKELYF